MPVFNTYKRLDEVVGVGFELMHCERLVHSIAWPDGPGDRMTQEEIERRQFVVESVVLDHHQPQYNAIAEATTTASIEDSPIVAETASEGVEGTPPPPDKKARKKRQG